MRGRRVVLPAAIGVLAVAVAGTGAAASTGLVPVRETQAHPHAHTVTAATHTHASVSPPTTRKSHHPAARTGQPVGPTWVDASTSNGGTPAPVTRTNEPSVAPLKALTPPDVMVKLDGPATAAQVDQLRHAHGVQAVATLDKGTVTTPAGKLEATGANPSKVRSFTPKLTAKSDALWKSQARGEMALAYSLVHKLKSKLGKTLPVTGTQPTDRVPLRLGGFASIGLPHTKLMVTHRRAGQLGLSSRRRVLVAAPDLSIDQLKSLTADAFGAGAHADVLRPQPVDQSQISELAKSAVPDNYLTLYRKAATTCPGLPWEVLAAIGTVETGNGADTSTSSAGAMGPMQFMPGTFRAYGVDASGDGIADINNPKDAIFSAAHYLCASGAGRGGQSLADAIFAYNHAWWYVKEVIQIAQRYQ